jgi:hypothetical protein
MSEKISAQDFYQSYRTESVESKKISPAVWWMI